MKIGENIKRLRIEKGLTQKQLGDLTGMADSAIRRYELGKANPKIETLAKIATALGTSCDVLRGLEVVENITSEFLEEHQNIDEYIAKSILNIMDAEYSYQDIMSLPITKRAEYYNSVLHHITFDNSKILHVYPYFIDNSPSLNRLSKLYCKLNSIGKQEALKRVEELTEIPRYRIGVSISDTPAEDP